MRKFFSLHRSGSELPYRMSDRILDMAGMALVILQLLLFVFLQEWEKGQNYGPESPSYAVWMVLAVLFWVIGFFASRNPSFVNVPVRMNPKRTVIQNYWKCHFARWLNIVHFARWLNIVLPMINATTCWTERNSRLGLPMEWAGGFNLLAFILLTVVTVVLTVKIYRAGRD